MRGWESVAFAIIAVLIISVLGYIHLLDKSIELDMS